MKQMNVAATSLTVVGDGSHVAANARDTVSRLLGSVFDGHKILSLFCSIIRKWTMTFSSEKQTTAHSTKPSETNNSKTTSNHGSITIIRLMTFLSDWIASGGDGADSATWSRLSARLISFKDVLTAESLEGVAVHVTEHRLKVLIRNLKKREAVDDANVHADDHAVHDEKGAGNTENEKSDAKGKKKTTGNNKHKNAVLAKMKAKMNAFRSTLDDDGDEDEEASENKDADANNDEFQKQAQELSATHGLSVEGCESLFQQFKKESKICCVVCMQKEKDGDGLVALGFVEPGAFGSGHSHGVTMSTCGHSMHVSCLDVHLESSKRSEYGMFSSFYEFLCPLCLNPFNSTLPILPLKSLRASNSTAVWDPKQSKEGLNNEPHLKGCGIVMPIGPMPKSVGTLISQTMIRKVEQENRIQSTLRNLRRGRNADIVGYIEDEEIRQGMGGMAEDDDENVLWDDEDMIEWENLEGRQEEDEDENEEWEDEDEEEDDGEEAEIEGDPSSSVGDSEEDLRRNAAAIRAGNAVHPQDEHAGGDTHENNNHNNIINNDDVEDFSSSGFLSVEGDVEMEGNAAEGEEDHFAIFESEPDVGEEDSSTPPPSETDSNDSLPRVINMEDPDSNIRDHLVEGDELGGENGDGFEFIVRADNFIDFTNTNNNNNNNQNQNTTNITNTFHNLNVNANVNKLQTFPPTNNPQTSPSSVVNVPQNRPSTQHDSFDEHINEHSHKNHTNLNHSIHRNTNTLNNSSNVSYELPATSTANSLSPLPLNTRDDQNPSSSLQKQKESTLNQQKSLNAPVQNEDLNKKQVTSASLDSSNQKNMSGLSQNLPTGTEVSQSAASTASPSTASTEVGNNNLYAVTSSNGKVTGVNLPLLSAAADQLKSFISEANRLPNTENQDVEECSNVAKRNISDLMASDSNSDLGEHKKRKKMVEMLEEDLVFTSEGDQITSGDSASTDVEEEERNNQVSNSLMTAGDILIGDAVGGNQNTLNSETAETSSLDNGAPHSHLSKIEYSFTKCENNKSDLLVKVEDLSRKPSTFSECHITVGVNAEHLGSACEAEHMGTKPTFPISSQISSPLLPDGKTQLFLPNIDFSSEKRDLDLIHVEPKAEELSPVDALSSATPPDLSESSLHYAAASNTTCRKHVVPLPRSSFSANVTPTNKSTTTTNAAATANVPPRTKGGQFAKKKVVSPPASPQQPAQEVIDTQISQSSTLSEKLKQAVSNESIVKNEEASCPSPQAADEDLLFENGRRRTLVTRRRTQTLLQQQMQQQQQQLQQNLSQQITVASSQEYSHTETSTRMAIRTSSRSRRMQM
eukprot:GDKJ01011389.1.p1 GENE.GDKJ01011389.1~~GDKJ01011389.1.p1  ORF type:complete len:1464 (-),score=490.26 GDKJ01011389.1:32-3967(-)